MKKVNFITPLSPQKQYEIRRWFWVSCILCISILCVGAYFIVPQLLTFIALKKEVAALREKTKDHAELFKNSDTHKKEHELLHERGVWINRYHEQPKNPHNVIAAIRDASGDGVKLESIRFNKKDVDLTVVCPTPEHATVFIKRLSVSDLFTGIKLVSLQHDGPTKQFRVVIKGNVVS